MGGIVDGARAAWADRIAGAWRKGVEAVVEAGRLLIDAKAAWPRLYCGADISAATEDRSRCRRGRRRALIMWS